jgi:glycosyltransferase involved in cell wall biosynthesis
MNSVSVVIRNKNEEQWIGHAIQSVIDWMPGAEIILVDNNSTDDSLNIVRHFIKDPNLDNTDNTKYTDIKILKIDDYTPGKSLNLGFKNCSNELCIVLSAHCVITKLNLTKLFEDINDYASIFGKQIPIWNGKKISKRYIWSHFVDTKCKNMYSDLEKRYFHHNAISIFNKTFILENPFDEFLQAKEDRYWAAQMISKGFNILYDPSIEVFHHYTRNGNTWKGLA